MKPAERGRVKPARKVLTRFSPRSGPRCETGAVRRLDVDHASKVHRRLLVRRAAGARCSVRLDSPAAVLNRGAHAADRARGRSRS